LPILETEEVAALLRGKDVNEIDELKRQGLSIRAISRVTGYCRKTITKYLKGPRGIPEYGPRPAVAGKLEALKDYLRERLNAGVWNGQVLLRELRERGYNGSYTLLTDWLRPQRQSARTVAVRRFETPPGRQAQVDWGHLGSLENRGGKQQLWGFTFTLGYSRSMMAEAAVDQKLGTLLRLHEEAFRQLGGVPEEILYDRMKTVWLETDERGEIIWHPVFLDFARYWGFTPRLCRAYRPQTKGKVESGVKYVRRNFLCGLQGQEPSGLADLNAQLRHWVWKVANQRVHGTTHEVVNDRWKAEQAQLLPIYQRPTYPYVDNELRKVGRDAYVSWQGSRYSVPWQFAGRDVWVHERSGDVEVHYGEQRIAAHSKTLREHLTVIQPEHHRGIPSGARSERKILIHIQDMAPIVEVRSLAAYESVFGGDCQ
jgi:transposase